MVVHDGLTVGNALRPARRRAGLAQSELARQAGTTRQTIGALEAGTYAPTLAVALRIARVLRCRVDELFSLVPEETVCRDVPCQDERASQGLPAPGWETARGVTVFTSRVSVVGREDGDGAHRRDAPPELRTEGAPIEQLEPGDRNRFVGTIAAIEGGGLFAEIVLDIGGHRLSTAIPYRSVEALGLHCGMRVTAVVTSADIVIDPAR